MTLPDSNILSMVLKSLEKNIVIR